MKRLILAAVGFGLMLAGAAHADPIEGTWKMPSGYNARIAPCKAGFCLTYINGPYKGKTFGTMTPTGGGAYTGSLTDYTKGGKQYSGKGRLDGDNALSVSGCVLGGLICRSQQLNRL